MDKIIKKLFCLIWGHNFHHKIHDMYCVRCGYSRPKTWEEMGFIGDVVLNKWDKMEINNESTDN